MSIYSVPILISAILCTLLSAVTWLLRRHERLNRAFSFFTLALAIDSFAYFAYSEFGGIEDIHTWLRVVFAAGFLVPIGLILFFVAFTGYDERLGDRVLGIRVRHFQTSALLVFLASMVLSPFTNLVIKIPDAPVDIWDFGPGPVAMLLTVLFACLFVYMLAMVLKSYRRTDDRPRKRFIQLLASGTVVWVLIGFTGVIFLPSFRALEQSINYMGTVLTALFYFVAIVRYQSDKERELNLNLERKVEDRTQELAERNTELEDTLGELREMQKQVIIQEKMATLGQLVAGLTHEINTPIGAIRSMNDTRSKAVTKLRSALASLMSGTAEDAPDVNRAMDVIQSADQVIGEGTDRLGEIIGNLKNFARLDEAEAVVTDIHEGLDSVLALIKHDLLKDIEVVRDYGEIPPFVCHARRLNQVFYNLLKNACQAIEGEGRITVTTELKADVVQVAIRDTGRGIQEDALESIFDPSFTTKRSAVRTSLGLSICYQIIQEHRGRITVESQPGTGSVFTVIIPMRADQE